MIGPTGTSELMRHLEAAYSRDIEIRVEDERLVRAHATITTEEFERDGVVYLDGDLRIIASTVDHGAAIKPAYGYRIEYQGRVAVISGDTRYNENVVKYGAGADLLVHEVAMAPPQIPPNLIFNASSIITRRLARLGLYLRGRSRSLPPTHTW